MTRKSLSLAIVLLIAGMAPVAAIIGFCTRMPCCSHHSEAAIAVAADAGDCCTTITCYDAAPAKLTTAAPAAPSVAPASVAAVSTPRVVLRVARTVIDTSPPRSTANRLAILSLLLI